jgi:hypothetical protein
VTVIAFRQKLTKRRAGKRTKGDGQLTPLGALDHMAEASVNGVFEVNSRSELARVLRWERTRTSKALDRWAKNGAILLDETAPGKVLIRVMTDRAEKLRGKGSGISRAKTPGKPRSSGREFPAASDRKSFRKRLQLQRLRLGSKIQKSGVSGTFSHQCMNNRFPALRGGKFPLSQSRR